MMAECGQGPAKSDSQTKHCGNQRQHFYSNFIHYSLIFWAILESNEHDKSVFFLPI